MNELKKSLKLKDAISIIAGSMIGSGIFIVSADMAKELGSAGWLLAAWIITGIITVLGAICYAELAAMFPNSGGQYVYLRESLGKPVGFLYGWTLFTVIQTGTIAAVAVAFAKFSGILIPGISQNNIALNIAGLNISTAQITAIISIIALTYINSLGIHSAKFIQNLFTFTKIGALSILLFAGLIYTSDSNILTQNFNNPWHLHNIKNTMYSSNLLINTVIALSLAMVGSIFSSDAWNNITFASGEIDNPKRTLPIALIIGTSSVIMLYILANVVYLKHLPLLGNPAGVDPLSRGIQFAAENRVGTAVMNQILGNSGVIAIGFFIVLSTFGCNNGLILSGSRVYYAMAQDNLFFKKAAVLNKHAVPSISLWIQCFWACLLCLSGSYGDLLDYVVFAVLLFYAITVIGLIKLRISKPDIERPYKVVAYPTLPVFYIIIVVIIMLSLLAFKTDFALKGLVIVLLGLPVYWLWSNISK